jgi:hypothetical protein
LETVVATATQRRRDLVWIGTAQIIYCRRLKAKEGDVRRPSMRRFDSSRRSRVVTDDMRKREEENYAIVTTILCLLTSSPLSILLYLGCFFCCAFYARPCVVELLLHSFLAISFPLAVSLSSFSLVQKTPPPIDSRPSVNFRYSNCLIVLKEGQSFNCL